MVLFAITRGSDPDRLIRLFKNGYEGVLDDMPITSFPFVPYVSESDAELETWRAWVLFLRHKNGYTESLRRSPYFTRVTAAPMMAFYVTATPCGIRRILEETYGHISLEHLCIGGEWEDEENTPFPRRKHYVVRKQLPPLGGLLPTHAY